MRKYTPKELTRFNDRTRLVLAGRDPSDSFGFVNPPIVRGSTVLYPNMSDFMQRKARFMYGTRGNPTIEALETAVNSLEGGAGCVLVPTGLMACTLPLLACLNAGDHVLIPDSVYRPTRMFCDSMLKRMGIESSYYDPLIAGDVAKLFKANTRAIFTESPGSQTFEVQDIPAIVEAAHARDLVVLMDNTWATPLYFDAHAFGVDYAIQAGTKYLAGHSDVLIGTISARTPELYKKLRETWEQLGVLVGSEDAFLTLRGSRTLRVRLAEQEKAGLEMAQWLQARSEVAAVHYPALPEDPGHKLWKRDFTGASSLFAITLKPTSTQSVAAMLDGLELFGMGASWGGYESLALPFDCSAYRTATKWNAVGPNIRFHIGLEDVEDLKADLAAGFERLRATA
ncbi:cystathionine beta-lyase [Terrarubrum flagellatum]|uniref:cystathionine beta-lyase n=1 Tax=Terrirubrum flagellatum TaxID=2895980 RepID=UPI003145674B